MLKDLFCFVEAFPNHDDGPDPGQLEVDERDGDGGADASEAARCACQPTTFNSHYHDDDDDLI